ncbi:hypothetical protein RchiOBHm_Chr4g0429871 [Rosa chinensis]|uniref:Uncharacterized protein n=1 Tax=Rosa chinensis TaxID=74649 RepID=A0A2P6R0A4_ROSCH|nr:hypothetical protein RchiOBHm_Chr4g0429871 [Rosa chinensis]
MKALGDGAPAWSSGRCPAWSSGRCPAWSSEALLRHGFIGTLPGMLALTSFDTRRCCCEEGCDRKEKVVESWFHRDAARHVGFDII